MRLSFWPFFARAYRRVRATPFLDQAVRCVTISPAIVSDRPPAISLPNEFERARGFFLPREIEHKRIMGGAREEGATLAYLFHDITMGGGAIYTGKTVDIFRRESRRFFLLGSSDNLDEALLGTTKTAEQFFGDWLSEGLSIELLAESWGVPAVGFARSDWLHEPGYRNITQLFSQKLHFARIRNFWLMDDRGINQNRGERFRELRARIRGRSNAARGPKSVYLARGNMATPRSMANEDLIRYKLVDWGFTVIEPERETAASLVALLKNANLAVTIEGSAQVHALLAMPEHSTLLVLQPPDRFTAPGKDMADMGGLRYSFLVGDPTQNGFSIDAGRLLRTLDLIGAGSTNQAGPW